MNTPPFMKNCWIPKTEPRISLGVRSAWRARMAGTDIPKVMLAGIASKRRRIGSLIRGTRKNTPLPTT